MTTQPQPLIRYHKSGIQAAISRLDAALGLLDLFSAIFVDPFTAFIKQIAQTCVTGCGNQIWGQLLSRYCIFNVFWILSLWSYRYHPS